MQSAASALISSFPNRADSLPRIRSFVSYWLDRSELGEDAAFEVLVAVGEAVGNSCRHGVKRDGRISVRCTSEQGDLVVEVSDDGPGFEWEEGRHGSFPEPLDSGGRGFFLMNELMDHVIVESSSRGTTVVLRRRLERQRTAAAF